MGKGYLIDSNIIIDFSANRIPKKGRLLLSKSFDEEPTISIITKIELLGYHSVTQEVEDLISSAIIAATAMKLNFILLSRNTSDFNKIEGLSHLDLYKF